MKNVLICIFIFASLTSYADILGTPDQDPTVKAIQGRFIQAKAPTESQLQYGRPWKCQIFEATKDGFAVAHLTSYVFSDAVNGIQNDGRSVADFFHYTSTGIVGADDYDRDGSVIEVRVSDNGDLIGEYSIPKSSLYKYSRYTQSIIIAPAIHDPKFRVISYEVCPNK